MGVTERFRALTYADKPAVNLCDTYSGNPSDGADLVILLLSMASGLSLTLNAQKVLSIYLGLLGPLRFPLAAS